MTSVEQNVVLGVDLGTSGVGVVALDATGKVVARADNPVPLHTPKPGWTQQDPADWLAAAEAGIREVAAAVGGARVRAIGLSGQMHGMVALDAADVVTHPALLWNDGRTAAEVEEIDRRVGRDLLVERTGNRPVPGFQLPKVLWLRRNEPEAFARTTRILFPKDYLGLHLTGEAYAEPTDASGSGAFDLRGGAWDGQVLGALDLDPGLWPKVLPSDAVVGGLRPALAARLGLEPGTPVVAGAGDNAAAAVALGLSAKVPELGSLSIGTSGVVQVPVAEPTPDPQGRVHLFAHADGGFLLLGVTLAAGGSLRWYRDTFARGRSYADLMAAAASSAPGAGSVTFVPYLSGERTPHMRTDLRGAFHGLSLATTEADVVRAVIEGVAFSLREARDLMLPLISRSRDLSASPPKAARFLATGGGAGSDLWLQILADLLGASVARPVMETGEAFEVGAAEGAAVLGWRGLGVEVSTSPEREVVFEPGSAEVEALDAAYQRYLALSRPS